MKKSIIFLINGLGIEKPGSYSISIDQCMPNLSKTRETSYFTTAVINSLESRSAYQQFFMGDTYTNELNYLKTNLINDQLEKNPVYQSFLSCSSSETGKIHIFLEPNSDKLVDEINELINKMNLPEKKEVYLHLILSQNATSDYDRLINMINYIKYHLNSRITVGFIFGKDSLPKQFLDNNITDFRKVFFGCSCERWSETDKKLQLLKEGNIPPCAVTCFCANNNCFIGNGDPILFFNTRRENYDNIIGGIIKSAPTVFKDAEVKLPIFSLVKLDTVYNIQFFIENVSYENTLADVLKKINKKVLIITNENNIDYINFLANGFNRVNNPDIAYMKLDSRYFQTQDSVNKLINESNYDLFIFDYHMDVSHTINDLKVQLNAIDRVLGLVVDVCVNKNSLFITSLYGIRKQMPVADYNTELVTIDYEMQIPIFFFDYSYPRSKYMLYPGDTNDILSSALKCLDEKLKLYSLVRPKGLINNIFGSLKK